MEYEEAKWRDPNQSSNGLTGLRLSRTEIKKFTKDG